MLKILRWIIALLIILILAFVGFFLYLDILQERVGENQLVADLPISGNFIRLRTDDYAITVWDNNELEFIPLSLVSKETNILKVHVPNDRFAQLKALIDTSRFKALPECLAYKEAMLTGASLMVSDHGVQKSASYRCRHDLKISRRIHREFEDLSIALTVTYGLDEYFGTSLYCKTPNGDAPFQKPIRVHGKLDQLRYRFSTGDWFFRRCTEQRSKNPTLPLRP